MEMKIDWLGIISAIAAWLAAWQAFRSSQIARASHKLSLEQEARLKPSLQVYLKDAYFRRGNESSRVYFFQLIISNKSDLSNSIKEIRLEIEHGKKHSPLSNILMDHKPSLATQHSLDKQTFNVPFEIGIRTSLAGFALFEVPNEFFKDSRIEAYTVAIVDTYGHTSTAEAIFLNEREI
jgi:hypothetical protein